MVYHYPDLEFKQHYTPEHELEWAVDLLLEGGESLQEVLALVSKELDVLLIYTRALRLADTEHPFILTSKYCSELCRNRLLVKSVMETNL